MECLSCEDYQQDAQGCACDPEWDFPTCLCEGLNAEIWELYSHYWESPVCENGVITVEDRRRDADLSRLLAWLNNVEDWSLR